MSAQSEGEVEAPITTPAQSEVLIVYGELRLGGIETLIVRAANAFNAMGVRCTVLCSGGNLISELDPTIPKIIYCDENDARDKLSNQKGKMNDSELLVVSFDPTTCALALWLDGLGLFGGCKHITGVFHPRAYFLEGEDRLRFAINRMVMKVMPSTSVFFMNDECRQTHTAWFKRDFSESPLLPLGIERKTSRWKPSQDKGLRVVSIGRLVAFKAYNRGAIAITRELRERGIEAQWHLYGSGDLKSELQSRIASSSSDQAVILHGDVRYANFAATVCDYDIFVGMGTAALEAAMLGMPVLMAVDGEEHETYGYLQELPFGNVGERLLEPPTKSFIEVLSKYSRALPSEKAAIGSASRSIALKYDIDHFCARMLDVGFQAKRPSRFQGWLAGALYFEATTGRMRRWANKARRLIKPDKRRQ